MNVKQWQALATGLLVLAGTMAILATTPCGLVDPMGYMNEETRLVSSLESTRCIAKTVFYSGIAFAGFVMGITCIYCGYLEFNEKGSRKNSFIRGNGK